MSTVLVVDDSTTQREMINNFLRKCGLKVVIATDDIAALEEVQGTQPDLIVLDIIMPQMNSYEVCRRLKADPKIQGVPIIICSTKGEEFDRYWGAKQGADAYLTKPFQAKELVATIKQLVRG